MIKKTLDIKNHLSKEKLFLFYGANEGFKNEKINNILSEIDNEKIYKYEEKEILDNVNSFFEKILSQSLFEDQKFIVIKRATDKIVNLIIEILEKKIDDIKIIINAGVLEKKSKLRNLCEKNNDCVCVAFYPDNYLTLSNYTNDFLRKQKILISASNINMIINKCNGDRGFLLNELEKIVFYCKNGKKLTQEDIIKLVNLSENHSIIELINSCLVKNKKKTIKILNENNFNNEDCILIARTFLNKLKKILKLSNNFEKNKNVELTISTAKPPIFWKDKEITKKQLKIWKSDKIKELIYNLNEIEFQIKKNINNSIALITDFILEQSSIKTSS